MDEKDLPSSSDESDADFVPKEEDNSDTGSEVSDDELPECEDSGRKGRKRNKKNTKFCKKAKTSENEKEDSEITEKKEIDVDALWADFKKDVNNKETNKTAITSNSTSKPENENKSSESFTSLNSTNTKQKKDFKLPTHSKVGGLSKVLNQIGKKDKLTTLQKSQLDWNKFKKKEGIEEEIKTFNKGKDGYLDKQDFLQRTDMRQFEIEKDLRCSRRKF